MLFKIQLLYVLYLIHHVGGLFKFTNLKCIEYDKSFVTIPLCRLKMVKRNTVALNMNITLHQLPVNDVLVNIQLLKKANGYRPFLYNVTVDFCKFMKEKRKYTFHSVIFGLLTDVSNLNHSCPIDHDVVVKNLVLNSDMFRLLPLPPGDYLVNSRGSVNKDWKVNVKVYISVTE